MRPTNDPNLTQIIAEYRYNRGGSREKLIRYGGKQITTDYLYNAASLVTSLTNKRGEEVLSAYVYTYYPDGNQKSKTSTVRGESKTVHYEYDAMGRLTCEREDGGSRTDYTYDALSNRKQMKVTGARAASTIPPPTTATASAACWRSGKSARTPPRPSATSTTKTATRPGASGSGWTQGARRPAATAAPRPRRRQRHGGVPHLQRPKRAGPPVAGWPGEPLHLPPGRVICRNYQKWDYGFG